MAKFTFDENQLTIGDLEDFEDAVGKELHEALKPHPVRDENGDVVRNEETGRPEQEVRVGAKVLKALVWIMKRHEDESFSIEDARKVRVTELDIVRLNEGDDNESPDPKD